MPALSHPLMEKETGFSSALVAKNLGFCDLSRGDGPTSDPVGAYVGAGFVHQ
jgi:hypothetical protein